MAWFQVDDQLAMHRKVCEAGNAAMGLWVRAGAWSMANLTEGFVSKQAAKTLGTTGQAKALVAAGLWIDADGGYQFHEWGTRQMSADQIAERRRKRAEAGRKGGQSRGGGQAKPEANASTNAQAKPKQNSTPVPVPTPEELSHLEYESSPNVGGDERGLSEPVSPSASRLVAALIPETIPAAVRTSLRLKASELMTCDGLSSDDTAETLRRWLARPEAGPGLLPHIAADIIRERSQPANGQPSSKLRTIAELAARERALENAQAAIGTKELE